jgi:hypothetical protein
LHNPFHIRYIAARGCLWVLLIAFANTFINVQDDFLYDRYGEEDISVNETETIVEWVLEDVLDIDDAIPEETENDPEKKLPGFLFDTDDTIFLVTHLGFVTSSELKWPVDQSSIADIFNSITVPPPDQSV